MSYEVEILFVDLVWVLDVLFGRFDFSAHFLYMNLACRFSGVLNLHDFRWSELYILKSFSTPYHCFSPHNSNISRKFSFLIMKNTTTATFMWLGSWNLVCGSDRYPYYVHAFSNIDISKLRRYFDIFMNIIVL